MDFSLIFTATGGNTRTLLMSDDGWYDAIPPEVGHEAADFDALYIIQVVDSDGVEVAVLSILTGADQTVVTPAVALVPPILNPYIVTSDGKYKMNLLAIPTYNNTAAYVYSTSNEVYVYDDGDGKVYKLIQTGTGQQPSSSPTYWSEEYDVDVTDMATMLAATAAKYQAVAYSYSSVSAEELWDDMMYRVHTAQGLAGDDATTVLNNPEWQEAAQVYLDLRALDGDITNENYDAIDDVFTRIDRLIAKYL